MSLPTPLSGAPNFRDLGGLASEDGRQVRPGLLFRSEGFAELTDADLEQVTGLGIRTVCDLRSDTERMRFASRWPQHTPVQLLHLNISADVRAGQRSMLQTLLDRPTAQGATDAMVMSYRQFPHAFADKLGGLFDCLLAEQGVPMVFHCSAGKDRTGFIAAILLHSLGVSWETIMGDYLRTADYWHGPRSETTMREVLRALFGDTPHDDVMAPLIAVDERYLTAAREEMHQAYGGIDEYLQAAGITPRQRETLRQRFLV